MRRFGVTFVLALFLLGALVSNARAFVFEVPTLEDTQISALSDEDLVSNYIDVIVELEASRTFYANSGFTPKEYKKFKQLLRYRIFLAGEIRKRELVMPQFEP